MTDPLNTKHHTDIKRLKRLEQYFPKTARPYLYLLRLDRPVGIWLLLLPCLWGIFLAQGGILKTTPDTIRIVALFAIGAIIMRGAGCVINDLWDRNLDKLVERTKNRPLAKGDITAKNALFFLASLLLLGFIILLQLNTATIILGFITLPLIATYPLMKRITWWPQAFLGITFNMGALMGWTAINGNISTTAITLYIGGIFWTLAYDTIYAHQDKEDDAMAGIKSTARRFKTHSKKWVTAFFITALICITLSVIQAKGITPSLALVGIPAAHATWQIQKWNPDNHGNTLKIFKSNMIFGLLITLICAT